MTLIFFFMRHNFTAGINLNPRVWLAYRKVRQEPHIPYLAIASLFPCLARAARLPIKPGAAHSVNSEGLSF